MIKNDIDILKKKIIYRFSYTGTLETDLLFNKYILALYYLTNVFLCSVLKILFYFII